MSTKKILLIKWLFSITLCIMNLSFSFGAKFDSYTDSLWFTYNNRKLNDSLRYVALSDLAWEYCYINPDSSRIFSRLQLAFFYNNKKYKYFQTDAINTIGNSFLVQGIYDSALIYFLKNEKLHLKANYSKGLIATYTNLAEVYRNKGNYPIALKYSNKALKVVDQSSKKIIDKAILYNNIGAIYDEQSDWKQAIKEYKKAEKIFYKLNEVRQLANVYRNLSSAYADLNKKKVAFIYARKSLALRMNLGDSIQISNSYMHIASFYYDNKVYDSSLLYAEKAIKIDERLNNLEGMAASYSRGGFASFQLRKYDLAIKFCTRGYQVARQYNNYQYLEANCRCLYNAFKDKGDIKNALYYYEEANKIEDTLFNEDRTKEIARLSVQYEFDKKTTADSLENVQQKKIKDAEIIAQQEQLKNEKLIRIGLFSGLFLMIVFGIFIYNRWRVTQKQKIIIEEQKNEVEHQKVIVEEKNKEILDSIIYAKRLQDAILPPMKLVKEYLKESFILYKPKDIVAGDFYFMEPVENKIVFAAADCTGHGVPGAMVSVVCANALNRAVKEFKLLDAGEILNKVRELVIETFEKSESEVKDGMDISLCVLDFSTMNLIWSGANNPLYLIKNNTNHIQELKPDKQPIGKYSDAKPFSNHQINLNSGDTIYLFTDGFADQFGGEKGKKFKASKMKELFISLKEKPMTEQRDLINSTFETWKGDLEQVDDICIIGVRI